MALPRIPLPRNLTKRTTLEDQLDRIKHSSKTEQWEVIEKVKRDSENFRGFRHHAPKTQNRQDHHLEMFEQWVLFKHGKTRDDFATQDDLDEFVFPGDDHERLFEDSRQFLIYVYQVTNPRSKMTGEFIAYKTLVHYRELLVFWVKRKYLLRGKALPSIATMYHWLTEAMRAVVQHYPNEKKPSSEMKAYLGLAELRMLFDEEMLHNSSIELSEQHAAVWCLIRTTACRAGSLVKSSKHTRTEPIRWSDFDFSTGNEAGKFSVTIHFSNIHIKQPADLEKTVQRSGDDDLHVTLESPQASNLIFSVAHRLLVIAIRRGLLQGIDTIQDLLDHKGHAILVKPDHKDDYVFYKGVPKGTGLDTTQPRSVPAVDDYLKRRAHRLGWVFKVMGSNAIRRRALTDLVTRIGVDATRRIAGHAPESFTLERYYLFVSPMFDQTSATLDQDITATGFTDAHRQKWAPLATNRIDDEAIKRTRGSALRAMTDRLVLADPDPPAAAATDANARKQYRKRLRGYAHTALKEHEAAQATAEMTKEQYDLRTAELDASKFANHVLNRAMQLRQQSTSGDEDYPDWDGFDDTYDQPEDDDDVAPEPDLEDISATGSISIPAEEEMEEEAAAEEGVEDLPYRDMAEVFMTTLLDNSLNVSKTWAEKDRTCPECQEDPTVTEADRAFQYKNESHLNQHLASNKHAPYMKFKRAAEIEAEKHPDGLYTCPYCNEAGAARIDYLKSINASEHVSEFETFDELKDHIAGSSEATDGKKHDELKELGGWYDSEDFFPKALSATRHMNELRAKKNLKAMGIQLIQNKPIPTEEPHSFPGVVTIESREDIPPRFMNAITVNAAPSNEGPAKFAGLISNTTPGTSAGEIPAVFRDSIVSLVPGQARRDTARTPLTPLRPGEPTGPNVNTAIPLISPDQMRPPPPPPRGSRQDTAIEVEDHESSSMDEDEQQAEGGEEEREEEEEENNEDAMEDIQSA